VTEAEKWGVWQKPRTSSRATEPMGILMRPASPDPSPSSKVVEGEQGQETTECVM